jgi:autotransporter-associated beta strand protein
LRLTGAQSANRYSIWGGTLKFAGAASIASGSEFGNSNSGLVDISELNGSGLTIAYNSGDVQWNLGNKTLTVSHNKVSDELYGSYRNVSYISDVSGEGGSLAKTGSSTLVVHGDNSYTGKTSANGGILVLQGNSVSQLEVNNGGRLLLAGTASGNAIVNGGRLDVGNVYDFATDKAAGFYGDQTGSSWNYVGNGILSANATVKAGGTLGGHGAILGLTSVETGGRIAPGTSIGSLSVASITFANNSTYEYEVNSSLAIELGADLLVVNGNLNMTLTQLAFSDLSEAPQAFGIGTIFSLMNYTGTWNGGLFALGGNVLVEGEEFYAGQNYWRINYEATTGGLNFTSDYNTGNTSRFINFTATAVPEPSVAMLGAAASLLMLRRRRS